MPPNTVISNFDELFVPKSYYASGYQLRRARIFVVIQLLVLGLIGLTFAIGLLTVQPEGVRLGPSAILSLAALWLFRRTGNMGLCGNLLAANFAQTIIPPIFVTGGLFSDNMVWLLAPPLIALLFSGTRWSFFWFMVSQSVVFYTFWQQIDPESAREVPLVPINFLLTYVLFFAAAMGIIWAFKAGQEDIIRDLQNSRRDLQQQQKALTEKTAELNKMGDQLRESNAELASFAYAASHDMKEPLRMIGMYVQLLKKRLGASLTADQHEFMGFVTDGVSRMQRLLDDLLEFSRVGKSDDDARPVDLNDTVFLVKTNLKALILDTSATVEAAPGLPTILGRNTEMVQLFQNLTANAIKFRRPDTSPAVRIDWAKKGSELVFSVADNGIGIAPEFQEKVFAIFARLHNREEFEGSGIGLATCRKIVESMAGRIWLTSELGRGTTFFIAFPAERLVHPMQMEKDKILVTSAF